MVRSYAYNLMIKLYWMQNFRLFRLLWNKTWAWLQRIYPGEVATVIHGYLVRVNNGHPYPIIARQYRRFNNPLIELVHQQYKYKGSVSLVDVGAGVGDTILMLQANCPDMVASFYCIDGDLEFSNYARKNLAYFENGKVCQTLLSEDNGFERKLVRTHSGTASAQGQGLSQTCTLDNLLLIENCVDRIDVLKIDVDGFDGKVLGGSRKILKDLQPAVIFEWHPILCSQTGNSWMQPFEVLSECGYTRFVWFTKEGEFSHLMNNLDIQAINDLAEFCVTTSHRYDWHYDVIALHDASPVCPRTLALTEYAMQRVSCY